MASINGSSPVCCARNTFSLTVLANVHQVCPACPPLVQKSHLANDTGENEFLGKKNNLHALGKRAKPYNYCLWALYSTDAISIITQMWQWQKPEGRKHLNEHRDDISSQGVCPWCSRNLPAEVQQSINMKTKSTEEPLADWCVFFHSRKTHPVQCCRCQTFHQR